MAVLEVKNVSIQFPGVKALDDVSVAFPEGKATALCGENGAGKSTLGKIIAGVYNWPMYTGQVILDGKEVRYKNISEAEADGITIIHQELNLTNDQMVMENVCMSCIPSKRGIIDYNKMEETTRYHIDALGLDINPKEYIRNLSAGKRQLVEIIKALSKDPKFIIFDEATSSLSENEIEILFDVIDKLKERKITTIFVTHKLDEIFRCCDNVVVLKDSKFVWMKPATGLTKHDIITGMIGRELAEMFPPEASHELGEELLRVEDWTAYDKIYVDKIAAKDINFSLKRGEILGIYGLVGAGRSELMLSIFEGKDNKHEGKLFLKGKEMYIKNPKDAVQKGIAFVTEDRKKTGLMLDASIRLNIAISSLDKRVTRGGVVDFKAEDKAVKESVEYFKIKVTSVNDQIKNLSGGNQQKVVISKWILADPDILIMDEPTRGIDVGTKADVYRLLRGFTEDGKGVIIISDEIPEILGISDRILVMCEGELVGEVSQRDANEKLLAEYALNVKKDHVLS